MTTPETAAEAAADLTDKAAAKADSVLKSTRNAANNTIDQLSDKVDELRESAPSILSRAAAQLEELTRQSLERAKAASAEVREKVAVAGDRTVGYIKDEPVKSVVIAAATGAAVAALIGLLARRR